MQPPRLRRAAEPRQPGADHLPGGGARGFRRLAIVAETCRPCVPCGACRQILIEHAPDLTLILEGQDGAPEAVSIRALLPRPFTAY